MTTDATSRRCLLCDRQSGLRAAGFQQMYCQDAGSPAVLDWWECPDCQGWFVDPPPTPAMIARNWPTVEYADLDREEVIAACKEAVFRRLLREIARRGFQGDLLDVGCCTGAFMLRAKEMGWRVAGYDPNLAALQVAHNRGLEVHHAWKIEECPFQARQFHAITAIDAFYYSWHPFQDLAAFYGSLRPGGVLAMRISNKRFVLGWFRRMLPSGERRDKKLSGLLQGQFHSISTRSLARVLKAIGYEKIQMVPRAATAPLRQMSWRSKAAYLVSDLAFFGSAGAINISPGVLLLARKPEGAGADCKHGASSE